MYEVSSVEITNEKPKRFKGIMSFIHKVNGLLEIIIILAIWVAIFSSRDILGDFTRREMITYIIFGNLIGIIVNYLLQGVLRSSIGEKSNELLIKNPILFLVKIFLRGFGQNFLVFITLGIINLVVLYFFLDNFIVNTDRKTLTVIGVMMFLAFVSDFLIIYLVRMFAFWSMENQDSHVVLSRLKKFVAGNYFPLSLLPTSMLNISFVFPFAYSFFVPAELYLNKIDIALGVQGLGIQMIWIVIIYYTIKFVSYKQKSKIELKAKELKIDN